MIHGRMVGNTGLLLPELGFGAAALGNLHREVSNDDARDLLQLAWDNGLRYFDTAPHYGQGLSERRLGDSLRRQRGSEYLLSTKVGRLLKPAGYADHRHGFCSPLPFDIHYDYSYDGVMRSFEDSLQRLGLDRIDILFMHDIGSYTHGKHNAELFPIAMSGGYRAMDELRRQGVVKAIGLGVNEFEVCEAALDHGEWDCFLLAGRYTLLDQSSLQTFLPRCDKQGCSVIIGGAYNSGILATGTRTDRTLYYDYAPAPQYIVDRVATLEKLCDDFNISLPAAALQFPLAHPAVVSVIPGMDNAKLVEPTLDYFQTEIPDAFWTELRQRGLVHASAPLPGGN